MLEKELAQTNLNLSLVQREFSGVYATVYLNTGSAGRKPASVLQAIRDGWHRLNDNPTLSTFLDPEPMNNVRAAVARLHGVPPKSILLVLNPSQGLHLLMHNFLRKPGDELLTTNHEHGCVYAIARHLEETRGVVTRQFPVDPLAGSSEFCVSILDRVTENTKLVVLSEVSCATGWRPELDALIDSLALLEIPLIIDGAHTSGHVLSDVSRYPMWVGSGHKWLGGPNGTGFVYVAPQFVPMLEPVWLGDKHFERKDADIDDLTRFESAGTADVVKWSGLIRALELYQELGPERIVRHQNRLVEYLRRQLDEQLKPDYRTPLDPELGRRTAIVTLHFPKQRVKVSDLPTELWQRHGICVRDDYVSAEPGCGLRVSCHYSVGEADLDALVRALGTMVERV